MNLESPKAVRNFRIYSGVLQSLIIPTLIGVIKINAEFAVAKVEIINLKEANIELKNKIVYVQNQLTADLLEEKADRRNEISIVRTDLYNLKK